MWTRSSLPLLLLLVLPLAVAGCGEEAPTVAHPLVRALDDANPDVRRQAAEGLGQLEDASNEVVQALLFTQYDDDKSVSAAAVAALDRIHPGPDVALRVFGGDCYADIADQVLVRQAYTTWRKVACEPESVVAGERLDACWTLAEVPPVYETRIRHVMVHPEAGRWRDAREVRADDVEALRAEAPPPPIHPMEKAVPPQGEPEGAQPGEVWCRHESASGGTWQRHPECEGP